MSISHLDYFNAIARECSENVIDDPNLNGYLLEFGVSAGDRILDLGAGTGRLTRLILELVGDGGYVCSLDIAINMLKYCHCADKSRERNVQVCADAADLPFKMDCFDKIICYSTFPHLVSPISVLRETERILRKNGKILILHSCCSKKLNAMHASFSSIVAKDRLPRADELGRQLCRIGFCVEKHLERPDLYWVECRKT